MAYHSNVLKREKQNRSLFGLCTCYAPLVFRKTYDSLSFDRRGFVFAISCTKG